MHNALKRKTAMIMKYNVNQLEKPVGPAWRVNSCVDVREHSRTGVTATTAPLFALFPPLSLQSCPCFRVPAPVHRRPNDAHQPTSHDKPSKRKTGLCGSNGDIGKQ